MPAEITRANPAALPDSTAVALGMVNWAGAPEAFVSATAPTSGTIYARAIWLPAGVPVTSTRFFLSVAGAGTIPTGIFAGYCNTTTVLAQSGNLNADSAWTSTGYRDTALSAVWTPSVSGLYYQLLLQNGSWGTTQMSLNRGGATAPSIGTPLLYATGGTAQTVLPANNAAITLASTGTPVDYWVAAV